MANFNFPSQNTNAAKSGKSSNAQAVCFINPYVKFQGEMKQVRCEYNTVFAGTVNNILAALVAQDIDFELKVEVAKTSTRIPTFANLVMPEVQEKVGKPVLGYLNYTLVDEEGEEFRVKGTFALVDTPLNRQLIKALDAGISDKLQWDLRVNLANQAVEDIKVEGDSFGFDL